MSRLSADDWAEAGLRALARGGLAAVAVEPLAVELGASKGSFYWHFRRRDDLVSAVVDRWERDTRGLIESVESGADGPAGRLRLLFERVFLDRRSSAADLALLAAADDPLVQAALNRVTGQRLTYLTKLMRDLGLSPTAARRRAVFAYSAFLGQLQLSMGLPDLLQQAAGSARGYADEILGLITATGVTGPNEDG